MYGALAVEGVGYNHPDAIPLKVACTVSCSLLVKKRQSCMVCLKFDRSFAHVLDIERSRKPEIQNSSRRSSVLGATIF